jgi:hypothetical protein
MKSKTTRALSFLLPVVMLAPLQAMASPSISGGVWFNYRNVTDSDFSSGPYNSDLDKKNGGDVADEALIIYVDDNPKDSPWSFSAETRFGPGSFTDTANNSTGDSFTVHKAWIGYQIDENSNLKLGKSQVPFGWKTVNFWPGDLLLGGYGDEMDVGLKYSRESGALKYDVAYYHSDDWGETSTDTTDDNGHWGSSTTYRKVHTVVANLDYTVSQGQTFGVSLQSGGLQDLSLYATSPADATISGTHSAANLHYYGKFDNFYTKAQYISVRREVPNVANDIENWRAMVELGYTHKDWFYYLDASVADTNTTGNSASGVSANAIGMSYNYGKGWMYLEYLTSDGDIDRNGDIYEANFSAVYATIDYYF